MTEIEGMEITRVTAEKFQTQPIAADRRSSCKKALVRGREAGSGSRRTEKLNAEEGDSGSQKLPSLLHGWGFKVLEGSSSSHLGLVNLKKDRMVDLSAAAV